VAVVPRFNLSSLLTIACLLFSIRAQNTVQLYGTDYAENWLPPSNYGKSFTSPTIHLGSFIFPLPVRFSPGRMTVASRPLQAAEDAPSDPPTLAVHRLDACLSGISNIAVAPSGKLYFSINNTLLYEIGLDDVVRLVAGLGYDPLAENAAGTSVSLSGAQYFKLLPSGDPVLVDLGRLFKISNGRIRFLAGGGACCSFRSGPDSESYIPYERFLVGAENTFLVRANGESWQIANGLISAVSPSMSVERLLVGTRDNQFYFIDTQQRLQVRSIDSAGRVFSGSYDTPPRTTGAPEGMGFYRAFSAALRPDGGVSILFSSRHPDTLDASISSLTEFDPAFTNGVTGAGSRAALPGEGDLAKYWDLPAIGGYATASALARTGDGSLYFGARSAIRRISPEGILTTHVGNMAAIAWYSTFPNACPVDGADPLTQAVETKSVSANSAGRVIWSACQETTIQEVVSGVVRTIAGGGSTLPPFSGQSATQARFSRTTATAFDASGRILVATPGYLHRIDASGNIATIAGTGATSNSGDGGPALAASFSDITAITVAADGAIVLATLTGTTVGQIRRIRVDGQVEAVAGTSEPGVEPPDGSSALTASLFPIYGLAFDGSGRLLVSEARRTGLRRIESGLLTRIPVEWWGRVLVPINGQEMVHADYGSIRKLTFASLPNVSFSAFGLTNSDPAPTIEVDGITYSLPAEIHLGPGQHSYGGGTAIANFHDTAESFRPVFRVDRRPIKPFEDDNSPGQYAAVQLRRCF
jgi:hypothetical protein